MARCYTQSFNLQQDVTSNKINQWCRKIKMTVCTIWKNLIKSTYSTERVLSSKSNYKKFNHFRPDLHYLL